ncbi:hypothetical protein MTR72_22065 [Bradyrhizobium sp. ISRA442]|uniref:hypothetical protein n=1 Tax=Bradyrhizobium sp. ISRA442 TaxID=2866197 RepID=UPI00311AE404
MPNTAISQPDAAARKAWQTEAEKQLAERMPQEIQKQLSVERLPYTAPPDNGD